MRRSASFQRCCQSQIWEAEGSVFTFRLAFCGCLSDLISRIKVEKHIRRIQAKLSGKFPYVVPVSLPDLQLGVPLCLYHRVDGTDAHDPFLVLSLHRVDIPTALHPDLRDDVGFWQVALCDKLVLDLINSDAAFLRQDHFYNGFAA